MRNFLKCLIGLHEWVPIKFEWLEWSNKALEKRVCYFCGSRASFILERYFISWKYSKTCEDDYMYMWKNNDY